MSSYYLTIFDDNNNVMFRSNKQTNLLWGHDSTVPQGKYYYRLQLITKTGKRVGKCGFVWLLRCMPANMPDSLDFSGYGIIPNNPLNWDPVQKKFCN